MPSPPTQCTECVRRNLRFESSYTSPSPPSQKLFLFAHSFFSKDVKFVNTEEANSALVDVRDDNSSTDWVLFGHAASGKDVIKVVGKGSGGFDEMEQHFQDEDIVYGVLRVVVEDEGESDYKTKK